VDVARHRLYAARDRLGKKPLHWTQRDGSFLFASELKALYAVGAASGQLSPRAIARFLCLRYVPDPDSVFAGVHKLAPAHWLTVEDGKVRTQRYWSLSFASVAPDPPAVLEARTRELLDEAVRIRLMGEVPLAPFLSGGIDSYAVVDSMTRTAGRPVQACTIGFEDPAFDERQHAREAAAACGATLQEEVVRERDLLDLQWYDDVFDEPFSDSSAVPTYHVSRLARRHVTVALSGDGGDEGFAGYRRYLFDWRENRVRRLLPSGLWRLGGALYPKLDWLPRWLRWRRTLQNLALPAELAYARSVSASLPEEAFAVLRPEWHKEAGDPLEPVRAAYRQSDAREPLGRAVAADLATWLPGDILTKVDRASMAVALEVRAPFLDHVLLEHAAAIPARDKLVHGVTKAHLRAALAGRLDGPALRRKKRGFSVPLRAWLQGEAGHALEQMLSGRKLAQWLEPEAVRSCLARHRSGMHDHGELLWACYTLGRFLERWTR
jgi:asparagine synthase (glutamine-hydrolysing)